MYMIVAIVVPTRTSSDGKGIVMCYNNDIITYCSELRTYGTTLTADGFSQTSIDFSKLPQVVIGNKRDLKTNNAKRVHNPTEEFRVDSFETSAWTGNVDHGRLNLFFDRIFREKTAAIHSNTNSSNVVTRRSKIQ